VQHQGDANALVEKSEWERAIQSYNQAFELVPAPQTKWHASTWILGAIADACYQGDFLESAKEALDYVMHCPDAVGNPFLHLRRGEEYFEYGELDAAAADLMRAWMGGGDEIFEDEDPKYRAFLATRANLTLPTGPVAGLG
jgi:tetratricopeptide (TPR) repeat protein